MAATLEEQMDYGLNIKLIHKITNKVVHRLSAMNTCCDRDDVFQEVSLAWVNCTIKFDKNRGIRFSTYFVRSAFNQVNLVLKKEERSPTNFKEGVVSEEGEDVDIFEIRDLQHCRMTSQEMEDGISMLENEAILLSDEARSVLGWLITPPDELIEYARFVDEVKERRGALDIGIPVVISFAKNIMGMSKSRMYEVRSEIISLAEKIGEK